MGSKVYRSGKPEDYLFGEPRGGRAGGDFDSRYSQRGVQWAVKQAKTANILKEVSVHTLRHSFATHLLEDGMDILSIKNLLGHESIDTTLVYLQIAQLSTQKLFSPLDTFFRIWENERFKNLKKQSVQPQSQPQYEVADVLKQIRVQNWKI